MAEAEETVDIRALRMQMRQYGGPVKSISHRLTLAASPHEVYETLLDPRKVATITGGPANISHQVGGRFSVNGGKAAGFVTELLHDQHIVLAWKPADERWPEDYYSTATFMLRPEGKGTTLVFFQQGVPEELVDDVTALWQESYWDRLKGALS